MKVFPTAADGLKAELDLLDGVAADGRSSALVWAADTLALTLPERFARNDRFQSASQSLAEQGWPPLTRRTGGGITPQGPGVINLALAYSVSPKDAKGIAESYDLICEVLTTSFATLGVTAGVGAVQNSFCDGDYNLEVAGRKIVGTAQRRRGAHVLCHALVLIDLDLKNAVAAAQNLSDALGLGDTYNVSAHTRLADEVADKGDVGTRFAHSLRDALATKGF